MLEENPCNSKAAYNLALSFQMSGKLEDAEKNYRKLYAQSKDVHALINLIALLRKKGELKEAESLLKRGRNDHPEESFLPYLAGRFAVDRYRTSRKEEELHKAIAAFKDSIALNPEKAEPYYRLALIYRGIKKEELAFQYALKAFKLHSLLGFQGKTWPEDFNKHQYDHNLLRYLMLLADIEEKSGRTIDAAKHLEQAIAQNIPLKEIEQVYDPQHRSILLRIGKLYYTLKRYRTALRYFEANRKFSPNNRKNEALLKASYQMLLNDPESRENRLQEKRLKALVE